MSTAISVKITPQGILIPREELGGLDPQSLEAIRENETRTGKTFEYLTI